MPFSDEDIYQAVKSNLPKVSAYVSSHGGGLSLLGVKDGAVYIELTGVCGGCSMSLMTTKMVVQKELRSLIHPELNVTNVDGTPENTLPDDVYAETIEEAPAEEKEGVVEKVKDFLHI
ncbi:MAG: NifU family protein [Epsilonproteobacteria bacterium]|nr:MAG: NifU family protein [Campylobacterota bacterium]